MTVANLLPAVGPRRNFNISCSPSSDCIINIVKRVDEFRTLSDKKRSGRPRATRSEIAI